MNSLINDIASDLQVKGWVNGNPVRIGRGTCLGVSTAICVQGVKETSYWETEQLLLTAAHIQTGKRWRNIPAYNDHPGRTFPEVMGVLEIARSLQMASEGLQDQDQLATAGAGYHAAR